MNAGHVSVTLDSESVVHQSDHRDPLAASAQSTSSFQNEILTQQVQAFLEASEDVDVDAETIEDILSVLISIEEHEEEEADPPSDLHIEEDVDSHDEDGQEISTLFPPKSEGAQNAEQNTWSKEEIKQMMHLLKESGSSAFIEEYVNQRNIPIIKLLEAFNIELCPELQDRRPKTMLYFLRVALSHQLRNRDKLPQYNTIADTVDLIRKSQRILILTGAGISVSCGIPDFRSRDGLYASLKGKGEYELDDPQQMFDIHYFKENPSGMYLCNVFYSFASQIYPSNFVPSPCHRFIKAVEDRGKNYTQNIDTLETLAGVKKVLQCHGSFATASCLQCRQRVPGVEIEAEILSHKVPLCKLCNTVPSVPIKKKGKTSKKKAKGQWDSDVEDESDAPEYPPGIMKPDITFFGEKLTDDFDHSLAEDRFRVDLLLVIGTSLKVSPVAEILSHLPHSIPQILINKTPIRHINPDIVLLGNADSIVLHLAKELGWELPPPPEIIPTSNLNAPTTRLQPPRGNLKKRASADDSDFSSSRDPERVGESHVWLFEGADGGKWLQQLQKKLGIPKSVPTSATNSGYNTRQSTPGVSPQKVESDGGRRTKKARAG
ncbi:NAD-dependent protein deacetylase hst1 [Psilocybe cubensis]|uniref:NAD-dependent protein deacetylase hst1 n=1 Tax=Psilocybe cubensis TaxID=181762 RepID=A0ACB8GVR5_PSICU|nr:NAD-dependent protein deacetylase hst1 [Psilocybe cubensis]KAH9479694.1 NAD-dependent protein deacetylase hst1 [Psilocybe cubensis]